MKDLLKIKKTVEKLKVKSWLDEMEIKDYTINDDLTVDVDGTVRLGFLSNFDKTEFPIQFGKVTGNFFCDYGTLTTLKGCPTVLLGHLDCEINNLKTLEHAPKKPRDYSGNPCADIYNKLGFTEEAHQRCREVFKL